MARGRNVAVVNRKIYNHTSNPHSFARDQIQHFDKKRQLKQLHKQNANAKLYVKRLQDAGQVLLNSLQPPYEQQQQSQYNFGAGNGDYLCADGENLMQQPSLASTAKSTALLAANAGTTSNFHKELVYVTNFLRTRSPKSLNNLRKSRAQLASGTLSTMTLDNSSVPQLDQPSDRKKRRSNKSADSSPAPSRNSKDKKVHPLRSSLKNSSPTTAAEKPRSTSALQTNVNSNQSPLNGTFTSPTLLPSDEKRSTPTFQHQRPPAATLRQHHTRQEKQVVPLPQSSASKPHVGTNKIKDALCPYDLTQAVKQLKRKIMQATNPNEPDKINLSEEQVRAELNKLNWIKYQEESRAQRLGVRESAGYIDRAHFALHDQRGNRVPVDIGGQVSKIWRIANPTARMPPAIFTTTGRGEGDYPLDVEIPQQNEISTELPKKSRLSPTDERKRQAASPNTLYEHYAKERIDRLTERNEQNSAWLEHENTTQTTIPLHFINATLPPPQATQIGLDDSVRYMPNERTAAPAMLQLRLPGFDAHTLKTLAASGGRNILPPYLFNPQRTVLMQRRMRNKLDLLYLKKLQNLTRSAGIGHKRRNSLDTTDAALSFSNVNLGSLLSWAPHLKIICPRCKRQKLNTLPKTLLRQNDGATRNLLIRLNLVCPFKTCDQDPPSPASTVGEKPKSKTAVSGKQSRSNSNAAISKEQAPRFVVSKEIDDKFVRNSRNRFARVARKSNFSRVKNVNDKSATKPSSDGVNNMSIGGN